MFPKIFLLSAGLATLAPVNQPTQPATAVYQADAALREGRSELLVLGTPHLFALPDGFDRSRLDPLIDRLAAWKPAMIMVEGIDGPQCETLRSFAFAYPGLADDYCPDPVPAQKVLGLTMAQAMQQIETILAKPMPDRPAAERRKLAALFLAAGNPNSAWVQWLRLAPAEQHADDVLTAQLAERFTKPRKSNENIDVAAKLAARLGLERVYPVDDHTGDHATGTTDDAFGQALMAIWKSAPGAEAAHKLYEDDQARMLAGGSVLDWYRANNSPARLRDAVKYDFAAAAADKGKEQVGRRYLAYWETRNLRMVANIRDAMGPVPGVRALAIVGASHKPYYERYMGVSSEVKIADLNAVLGSRTR